MYDQHQQCMRYLVELTLEGDEEPSVAATEKEVKGEEAELPESEDETASSDQGKDS